MKHRRGGDLYFESGKDACMSSYVKTLHIFFILLQEKSSMKFIKIGDQKKRKRKKEKKKRIIKLKNNKESWF
jgi:hypothetical protein